MKLTQIFILHVLLTLSLAATNSTGNKCRIDFSNSFESASSYYTSQLENCQQISTLKKRRAAAATQEQYEVLSADTYLGCYSLQQCNRIKVEEEALDCLYIQTWKNFLLFNKVSYEANRLPAELRNTIRLIDDDKYYCSNETTDQLHVETLEFLDELIKCEIPLL